MCWNCEGSGPEDSWRMGGPIVLADITPGERIRLVVDTDGCFNHDRTIYLFRGRPGGGATVHIYDRGRGRARSSPTDVPATTLAGLDRWLDGLRQSQWPLFKSTSSISVSLWQCRGHKLLARERWLNLESFMRTLPGAVAPSSLRSLWEGHGDPG
jgi:hypothetical protein